MKSSFQTILIGIFIASFIGAILIFAGVIKIGNSSSSNTAISNVRIWGVYSQDIIQPYVEQLNIQNRTISTSYIQKNPDTLRTELIEALANGTAPDIVVAGSGELFSFSDKLYTIPFATYNERLFRDSFVDGASIFLTKEGVLASPLLVDPLVVYYNKDLLAGQRYVTPPNTWSDLVRSLPLFLKKDSRGVITQTSIALGESSNIPHFKDILSALFLQTGNPIVSIDNQTGLYEQRLNVSYNEDITELPTVTALNFYTSFANQANSLFSWSRTLPSSLDMFLSGKSAFYIGKASELFIIQSRNPNLNFDVTTMFQNDDATRPITYGDFSGVGIVKSSPNFTASYNIVGALTSREFTQYLSNSLSVPSARRDLLLEAQQNPYVQVFFQSVLSAFGWPDTNKNATEAVFRDMIRNVNSGATTPTEAIYEASRDLQSIVR
ncbi:MAG: multiple sugar transport system substrate-binding protein [Patescibacteria group bacterium]|nr:multiple sugar transport system substrate-binding protein [Patescibacteria group bacterium]